MRERVFLAIDAVQIGLEAGGTRSSLLVPVTVCEQRAKLRFPIAGDFVVVTSHASSEGGHEERSQSFPTMLSAWGSEGSAMNSGIIVPPANTPSVHA